MKKFWLATVATLLLGATIASAQTTQDGLTLDTPFEIKDLGINLALPSGWVASELGTAFAPSQDILDAYSDGDDATPTTGLVVSVIAAPLEAANFDNNTPLDTIVDSFATSLEEKETRSETNVLGHRAVVIFGTAKSNGGDGILAVWTQDQMVAGLALVIPTGESYLDYAYEFGQLLGGIRPVKAQDILQVVTEELTNQTINIPEDWTYKAYPEYLQSVVFSSADDLAIYEAGSGALQGVAFYFIPGTYEAFKLADDATTADLRTVVEAQLTDAVYQGEFNVNGANGIGCLVVGADGAANYYVLTINPETKIVNNYVLSAPSEEVLQENLGTFLFMLSIVKPVE